MNDKLKEAFNLVANPNDWKDSIDAVIPDEKREIVRDAIIHYTATIPIFEKAGKDKLRVMSEGYRMGPAGDY